KKINSAQINAQFWTLTSVVGWSKGQKLRPAVTAEQAGNKQDPRHSLEVSGYFSPNRIHSHRGNSKAKNLEILAWSVCAGTRWPP
ncbi:hypothetical protein STEG23_034520, partial [Scotinomys teguina]